MTLAREKVFPLPVTPKSTWSFMPLLMFSVSVFMAVGWSPVGLNFDINSNFIYYRGMISYLSGKIILKKEKFIILETGGVGYKVFLSRQTTLKLPENLENIKVFCFHNIKEEASDLYGFMTYEELEFFEILMDIHGVGPKAALEISVLGPLEKMKDKILAGDVKMFQDIPNIGAKKAMTIILELTGKIKLLDSAKVRGGSDAEDALMQLGFTRVQVRDALKIVDPKIKNTEERIKLALKSLGK